MTDIKKLEAMVLPSENEPEPFYELKRTTMLVCQGDLAGAFIALVQLADWQGWHYKEYGESYLDEMREELNEERSSMLVIHSIATLAYLVRLSGQAEGQEYTYCTALNLIAQLAEAHHYPLEDRLLR